MNGNAFARSRLPRNRDVTFDGDSRLDVDDTAHVKDDNAVPLTDCIAERPRTIIIQVGNVINRTVTATRDMRTKA